MIQYKHFLHRAGIKLKSILEKRHQLFLLAFFLVILVSVAMVLKEKNKVFLIYRFGSIDFWQGVNSYSTWQYPLDRYLYGPVFSIFFSAFAFLPSWLGAVLWNVFNFSLFFIAVFYLPANEYSEKKRRFIFLFLFPIVLTDLFYFQANVFVTSLFLLAYSLLERNKSIAAISILLFSGFAKIYGFVQLATLLFYRNYWKKAILLFSGTAIFIFIPLLKIPFSEILSYYQSWFIAIDQRHNPVDFEVIYRLLHMLQVPSKINNVTVLQGISALAIGFLTLFNFKKFADFTFRTRVLGLVFTWVILFSTTAEKHTYVIAMTGFVLWFLAGHTTNFDRILLWLNFVIIILVPIDAIIPKPVMHFLYYKLGLNLVLFTITWFRMFYITFWRNNYSKTKPENFVKQGSLTID